jgi:peptide/nickel transport system substrate-binding protein
MDQERPELLESNVKGKNPFKDKKVREAIIARSTSRPSSAP